MATHGQRHAAFKEFTYKYNPHETDMSDQYERYLLRMELIRQYQTSLGMFLIFFVASLACTLMLIVNTSLFAFIAAIGAVLFGLHMIWAIESLDLHKKNTDWFLNNYTKFLIQK